MFDNQESTAVLILTATFSVRGSIALLAGSRLTDFVRQSGEFIAVLDATVSDLKGNELFQAPFLDIGKTHIVVISPLDSVDIK